VQLVRIRKRPRGGLDMGVRGSEGAGEGRKGRKGTWGGGGGEGRGEGGGIEDRLSGEHSLYPESQSTKVRFRRSPSKREQKGKEVSFKVLVKGKLQAWGGPKNSQREGNWGECHTWGKQSQNTRQETARGDIPCVRILSDQYEERRA